MDIEYFKREKKALVDESERVKTQINKLAQAQKDAWVKLNMLVGAINVLNTLIEKKNENSSKKTSESGGIPEIPDC